MIIERFANGISLEEHDGKINSIICERCGKIHIYIKGERLDLERSSFFRLAEHFSLIYPFVCTWSAEFSSSDSNQMVSNQVQ
jgi:hypothetical protein